MNIIRKIAKNTSLMLVSQIACYILGFLYVMYIARYLGTVRYGVLSSALAFTGIFSIFINIGLNTLIVRDIARDNSLLSKYLGNIEAITAILSIIMLGLIFITINALNYPKQTIKIVYILALCNIFTVFNNMFYSVFQAHEKMEYKAVGTILNSLILLTGSLFAISKGYDVVGFATLYVIASVISLGYAIIICSWKFVLPKYEVDWHFWLTIVKEALPFGIMSFAVMIYFQIDRVMLSSMIGDNVVGYYSAAYTIAMAILFFYHALSESIFPCMSNFYGYSKDSFILIAEKSFKYLWMLAIPIGIGTTILANRIITLIYGVEYAPAGIALQILVWAHVIIYMNSFSNILNNLGKQTLVTKQTMICAVLNILLNFMLIPRYSYIGASIATVITELFAFIILYYYVSKTEYKLSNKKFSKYFIQFTIAAVTMGIFIKCFENLNILVLILISIIIYFSILIFIKAIDEEDIQLTLKLIGKENWMSFIMTDKLLEK